MANNIISCFNWGKLTLKPDTGNEIMRMPFRLVGKCLTMFSSEPSNGFWRRRHAEDITSLMCREGYYARGHLKPYSCHRYSLAH